MLYSWAVGEGLKCNSDAADDGRYNDIVSTGEGVAAAEWRRGVLWVSEVLDIMALILSCWVSESRRCSCDKDLLPKYKEK
jgi:hypothetical protein